MRRVSAMGVRWPGYAATVWALLFAVPSFVWALGGTVGARTTVSPSLVKLAQDRVTWFVVVLWVTGALKLIGALIGFGLTRRWGTATGRVLVCCGWGAAVLLVWHGLLFVIGGCSSRPAPSLSIRHFVPSAAGTSICGAPGSCSAAWPSVRQGGCTCRGRPTGAAGGSRGWSGVSARSVCPWSHCSAASVERRSSAHVLPVRPPGRSPRPACRSGRSRFSPTALAPS